VKNTSTFSVRGRGISLEWVPLRKGDFKRLTTVCSNYDEVRAYFDRSHGGSGPLNGRCGTYINNRKSRDIRLRLKDAEVVNVGGRARYLLVAETWEKGDFGSTEIEGKFDKHKLSLGLACYRLNDGTTYNLVSFGYDADEELEFETDTNAKETNYFVVTREGRRYPVKFKAD
jgi:hypothetical protein